MIRLAAAMTAIAMLSACGEGSGGTTTTTTDADGNVTTTTTASTGSASGGIAARATTYHCVSFSGSVTGGGSLTTSPGFTINPDGSYTHDDGSTGTLSMTGDTIEFHGGALDGQAAKYEDNGGKGVARLYNEDRTRTVIDCDGA